MRLVPLTPSLHLALPRASRLVLLVLTALVLVATSMLTSANARADDITWSVVPADPTGEPQRVSLRHEVEPGGRIEDAISVTNASDIETTFTVQPGDGLMGADGAFDVSTEEPTGSGAWIAIDGLEADGRLTIAAGETRELPVTVSVPVDATPGDHPAGIVVGRRSQEGSIGVTHRIGVRLHLRVAGEITPALGVAVTDTRFTPSWIPFAPGTLRVSYDVTNTGNVRLGHRAELGVTGPAGLGGEVTADAEPHELLPGESAHASMETSAWPVAFLSGEVMVRPQALGADQTELPEPVAGEVRTVAMSWTGLAVMILVVGVVALAVIRSRRSRKTTRASEEESDGEATLGG